MTQAAGAMAALRLRSVTCIPVEVPLRYVLGTSAATVRAAPLLLVEVLTDAIAREPVKIENGCWPMNTTSGTGLAWDADAVERYRIA